jgi:hypothetical protein
MPSFEEINKIQIKILLARHGGQLEQQSRRQERMAGSTKSTGGDLTAVEDSASSLKNSPKSCPASSNTDKKLPKPAAAAVDNEVQSPPPVLTPPLHFTLYGKDDCDEAEKLARAKRIEVILRLSAEAKAKEAERKRVASIRPLTWAEPTFHYPSSSSSNSSTTTAASEVPRPATPGKKRKERQDETTNYPFTSNRFNYPRQPTEEELQALLDFTDTWFPSSKRKCTDMDGDDNN